jgi:hypothetical protein
MNNQQRKEQEFQALPNEYDARKFPMSVSMYRQTWSSSFALAMTEHARIAGFDTILSDHTRKGYHTKMNYRAMVFHKTETGELLGEVYVEPYNMRIAPKRVVRATGRPIADYYELVEDLYIEAQAYDEQEADKLDARNRRDAIERFYGSDKANRDQKNVEHVMTYVETLDDGLSYQVDVVEYIPGDRPSTNARRFHRVDVYHIGVNVVDAYTFRWVGGLALPAIGDMPSTENLRMITDAIIAVDLDR